MNEMEQLEDMCAAVPPPDPQQLASTRAQVLTTIANRRAAPPRLQRPRPRWVAPVAAAAAVAAIAAVAATVPGAIRGSGSAAGPATDSSAYTVYAEILYGQAGLVPISTATNKPGRPINVRHMSAMAVTPDGKTIYAGTGDTVIPINAASHKSGRPIRFHGSVSELSMNPDGKTAYAQIHPHGSASEIVPFSTATNTPRNPIYVADHQSEQTELSFTPDGKIAYAGGNGTVTPINTVTNTAGTPIRVGMLPDEIDVNPDGKTIYAVGFQGTRFTVLPVSTTTNTPATPIPLPDSAGAPMTIAPDGKFAYVTGGRSDNVITPVNLTTNKLGKAIPIPIPSGDTLSGIVFTPDGRTAYVSAAGGDAIVPVSTATLTAGPPIKVGPGAQSIAITPDGRTLYAFNGKQVVPVSTATNAPGKPIPIRGLVEAWDLFIAPGPASCHNC
jgi:DNA-binding beta-propeller fold protein YncE